MRPSLNGNRLMPSQTKNASRYSCACKRADASVSGRKCSLYRCTQPQGQGRVVDHTGCRRSVPACNQRLHQGRSPAQPRTQGSWLLTRVRTSAEQNWLVADNPSIHCPADLAEKDWPIYRAAHACKANVLLTGDHRDLGFLMNAPELANGLLIQPVVGFLSALGGSGIKAS